MALKSLIWKKLKQDGLKKTIKDFMEYLTVRNEYALNGLEYFNIDWNNEELESQYPSDKWHYLDYDTLSDAAYNGHFGNDRTQYVMNKITEFEIYRDQGMNPVIMGSKNRFEMIVTTSEKLSNRLH